MGEQPQVDFDELGKLADRLDNALAATRLPVSPAMHIEGMKGIISDVRDELRSIAKTGLGYDPWELQP